MDNDTITLHRSNRLNPATLLPTPSDSPQHNCLEVLSQVVGIRPDLSSTPLEDPDLCLWTDGSSFVREGRRFTGFAVVGEEGPLIMKALPAQISAQGAELEAVIKAAELATGKRVNIYTDSRYSFLAAHTHAALWKARGYVGADGKPLKMAALLERLMAALLLPREVAVIHCPGHQSDESTVSRGNQLADRCAKKAALGPIQNSSQYVLVNPLEQSRLAPLVPFSPEQEYAPAYNTLDALDPAGRWQEGWWVVNDKIQIPSALLPHLIRQMHQSNHASGRILFRELNKRYFHPQLRPLCLKASTTCFICLRNNPRGSNPIPKGHLREARYPGEAWQADFTEMPKSGAKRYLLVFVDLFSGWPEAIPCRTQTAREVAQALVDVILPTHSLPLGLESDNGTQFIAQVVQDVSKYLGIKWSLHAAYRGQSSSKVEHMNYIIKKGLAKLCQETHLQWPKLLPIVLTRIRATHSSRLHLSPFELHFGRPFVALKPQEPAPSLPEYFRGVGEMMSSLYRQVKDALPPRLDLPLTIYPGDWVLVKELHPTCVEAKWSKPRQVLLSTPTAVKVEGIKAWVHLTRVKKVAPPDSEWACEQLEPLRIKIHRRRERQAEAVQPDVEPAPLLFLEENLTTFLRT